MSDRVENELICEKLLGWGRGDGGWIKLDGFMYGGCGTPSFDDWASAGLILDAWAKAGNEYDLACEEMGSYVATFRCPSKGHKLLIEGKTLPLAIRATALAYIRATQQANAGES